MAAAGLQGAPKKPLFRQFTCGKELSQAILALTEDLRKGTINRILKMDEAELAMKVLSGELKLPGRA